MIHSVHPYSMSSFLPFSVVDERWVKAENLVTLVLKDGWTQSGQMSQTMG